MLLHSQVKDFTFLVVCKQTNCPKYIWFNNIFFSMRALQGIDCHILVHIMSDVCINRLTICIYYVDSQLWYLNYDLIHGHVPNMTNTYLITYYYLNSKLPLEFHSLRCLNKRVGYKHTERNRYITLRQLKVLILSFSDIFLIIIIMDMWPIPLIFSLHNILRNDPVLNQGRKGIGYFTT